MICLIPAEAYQEEMISAIKSLKPIRGKYKQRIVKTPQQLSEKIRIFDAGMNDMVVEYCKATLFDEYCKHVKRYNNAILLSTELVNNPVRGFTIKYDVLVNGKKDEVKLIMDNKEYTKAKRELISICNDLDSYEFQSIDYSWALGLLSNIEKHSPIS